MLVAGGSSGSMVTTWPMTAVGAAVDGVDAVDVDIDDGADSQDTVARHRATAVR